MVKWINIYIVAIAFMGLCVSCSHDDDEPEQQENSKTLLMYFPWSGDSNPLTSSFWINISDMKKSYEQYGRDDESVVVFICTSATKAVMFNLSDYKGNDSTALDGYVQMDNPSFTTVDGISNIINTMKSVAPATTYAMIVGCHGLGWIPVQKSSNIKRSKGYGEFKPHWEYANTDGIVTRFFGGTSTQYQVDISTFANALTASGTKLQFLLFDDCYMSSIEVAYDLRDVTDYLIACPTEIMGYGMPYSTMGRYLLGAPDYEEICLSFYDFYSSYSYPYGTIGVTKTSELDALAAIAKEINDQYTFDTALRGSVQRMDGYTPVMFYDYGDYVSHLCSDSTLLQRFNEQLEKTVPYKAHTLRYYSNTGSSYAIKAYSGVTTSEPSTNSKAVAVVDTEWYKVTH